MNELEASFPRLRSTEYQITSPVDATYNCAAWAAGDTVRWWWPDARGLSYWPDGVPRERSVDAFLEAYGTEGFEPTISVEPDPLFEKIAIYAKPSSRPTHMTRQLPSGRWTSKLGGSVDIEHDLDALESSLYGHVVQILVRAISPPARGGDDSA